MIGFWLCLLSIVLYVAGTIIEYFAKVIHGGSSGEDDEEEDPF